MGTLTAESLIAQASELAQDEDNLVWTAPQALAWLNDAQRVVSMLRPDASVLSRSIVLVPGTRQSIEGLRLMAVVRNMGSDGTTPGRAIRLVDRAVKDEVEPWWHTVSGGVEVREYIYDVRAPKEFFVSPPVHESTPTQIEVLEAVTPENLGVIGDTITIADSYAPALIEWIAYRFFSRDAEEAPNMARATAHYSRTFELLQVDLRTDMEMNPKNREHLT
mgnify:CR=1 FL=1